MKTKTNFLSTELGVWATVVGSLIAALASINLITGCAIPMQGGGEIGIGMRDNMFVIYHKADKDNVDATAKIALEVEASVLEAILGTRDEPNDEMSSPSSVDPGE
jgi:hypothetical protein